jgi:nascent polypeptide-associated complex subunit alpha
MFGGLGGGFDPSKMKGLMKQMGIKQEEVDASRVIIEKKDGTRTIIENPSVSKIIMKGQESWQVSGEAHEESGEEGISEDDINLVMEKTGKSEKEVKEALEECNGDIAETIVRLSR